MKIYPQKSKLKLLLFLCCLSIANFVNGQESKDVLSKAINETSEKVRGVIKPDSGAFRLDYDDVYESDTQAKFLQEKGFHGGGPSWLGIIYGAFTICQDTLIANMDSDVSLTGVSFWSDSKDDLEKIRRVISVIKSDEKILLEAIENAKKDDMML